jgi:NCAIR mutase (PurE)-related protein
MNGKIRLEANGADLSLKVSFKESNAELLAQSLSQGFYQVALSAKNTLTKQVYENTKATSKNNQVFIVTRLPRGSLDALLKQDAKAENQ